MGLFSRKKDAEGLYTGDAPVSAPGVDGAAPTAYVRSAADSYDDHAGHAGPARPIAPDNLRSQGQLRPGPAPVISIGRPTARNSPVSCLLVLVIVLAIAGVAVYAVVRVVGSIADRVQGATGAGQPPPVTSPALTPAPLGTPVTVRFGGATFEVTVFGATAQPGDAWQHASSGDDPVLTVDAQLRRTDAGTDPVRVLGWNWWVAGAAGKRVTGDIITSYQPALDRPELAGGESARGFLSFDTAVTGTTLTLATGPSGLALATWTLRAATPRVVIGALGTPVRGQIAQPGFAVTVGNPRQVSAGDKQVHGRPKSGKYLLLDLAVTADRTTTSGAAQVDSGSLLFVPAGGAPASGSPTGGSPASGAPTSGSPTSGSPTSGSPTSGAPLESEFAAVDGALSILAVDPGTTAKAVLAFDTTATSGELRLVDGAGHTVITWRVATG